MEDYWEMPVPTRQTTRPALLSFWQWFPTGEKPDQYANVDFRGAVLGKNKLFRLFALLSENRPRQVFTEAETVKSIFLGQLVSQNPWHTNR